MRHLGWALQFHAAIVADQAGPTYNVGPVAKLTIPGLQGSPKYDAFYGAIAGTTTGGFVGNKAVPTAADIASALDAAAAVGEGGALAPS